LYKRLRVSTTIKIDSASVKKKEMKTKMFIYRFEPQIYAILRMVTGFLFLWHGSQKLFGYPPSGHEMPSFMYFAGAIEFFGGILVMVGFWTSTTAFICSGEMAVAYWAGHGIHAVLPVVNMGELAMLYCFLFLFISARGAGIFSIDHLLERRKSIQ
jgi:putative oxidoreductase